jgi:hypothetical protein
MFESEFREYGREIELNIKAPPVPCTEHKLLSLIAHSSPVERRNYCLVCFINEKTNAPTS